MNLLFPDNVLKRLRHELRKARAREIGGVLVGEHIADDTFRIVDLSVQVTGGTAAHFVRDPVHHEVFLAKFFRKTGNEYERFNYIGEWHSHPSFEPVPSGEDVSTMTSLVYDPAVGVNFAVLIIARLRTRAHLQLSATLFQRGANPRAINVTLEDGGKRQPLVHWLFGMFGVR